VRGESVSGQPVSGKRLPDRPVADDELPSAGRPMAGKPGAGDGPTVRLNRSAFDPSTGPIAVPGRPPADESDDDEPTVITPPGADSLESGPAEAAGSAGDSLAAETGGRAVHSGEVGAADGRESDVGRPDSGQSDSGQPQAYREAADPDGSGGEPGQPPEWPAYPGAGQASPAVDHSWRSEWPRPTEWPPQQAAGDAAELGAGHPDDEPTVDWADLDRQSVADEPVRGWAELGHQSDDDGSAVEPLRPPVDELGGETVRLQAMPVEPGRSASRESAPGRDRDAPERVDGESTDQVTPAEGPVPKRAPDPDGPLPGGGVNAVRASWRKLSSASALIWVLLALFGFTLVVQLRSNDTDQGLATARQEDLVRILSDLEARDTRLSAEINTLEQSQRQLTSGVAGRQAALAEADKRADELGLLAGTLPGRGPGLRIIIDPKAGAVKASAVLNAVQELRGAGGEVMELDGANGAKVRIVASTYFIDASGGGIVADNVRLTAPYTLWVIGAPQTMQTALQIPGGVVASVESAGGSVAMDQRSLIEVTALRKATDLQYARPVS